MTESIQPRKTENARRQFAVSVVERLRETGHEAFWAGGCVRDALLGKTPKDYDVATDAEPDRVREVFGRKRTIAVGASFGVITVLGPKEAGQIEVATFRADAGYSDGRRPDAVRYTDAREDAARRDFTINGLFFDPIDEKVIDYVDGQRDLRAGLVRAIGGADERIQEDRLRMLRAVRFAASLGFELDETTADAIRRHADALPSVSSERIGAELRRMLTESGRARAIELLNETRLLAVVLPILGAAGSRAVAAARERLARLDNPSAPLALAAVVAETAETEEAAAIARGLKWTSKEWERISWLVRHRNDLDNAPQSRWSVIQPLLAAGGGAELVDLRCSFLERPDETDAFCRERLARPREQLDPPPLVLGADLIASGLKPGPRFSELLRMARAAQLDGEATDKQQALRLIGVTEDA